MSDITIYGVNITTIIIIVLVIFLGGKIFSKLLKIILIIGLIMLLLSFNFWDYIVNFFNTIISNI